MIRLMTGLIGVGLVILLVAMAVTNPGQDAHKKVVYESIAASKTNSEFLGKIAADMLGNANVFPVTYNNYYLLSTTTVEGKTASVGMFSKVWNLK